MEGNKATQERQHKAYSKFLNDRWLQFKQSRDNDLKTGRGRVFHYVPKGNRTLLREDEVLDIDNYLKDYELEMESKK